MTNYSYPSSYFVRNAKLLAKRMRRAYRETVSGDMVSTLHLIGLIRNDIDNWQEDLLTALYDLPAGLLEDHLQAFTEICQDLPEPDRSTWLAVTETVKELIESRNQHDR